MEGNNKNNNNNTNNNKDIFIYIFIEIYYFFFYERSSAGDAATCSSFALCDAWRALVADRRTR